jgi:hypothetical protein
MNAFRSQEVDGPGVFTMEVMPGGELIELRLDRRNELRVTRDSRQIGLWLVMAPTSSGTNSTGSNAGKGGSASLFIGQRSQVILGGSGPPNAE